MQQPKPKTQKLPAKKIAKPSEDKYIPTREDIEFSKRSGIPLEDVIAQGGVTPASVIKQIKEQRAYDVRYTPSGLYKKSVKNIKKK